MANNLQTSAAGATDIEILEVDDHGPEGTRVRNSAIAAGTVVALATFVLLELLLLTSDLSGSQVSVANPDTGSWIWDGIAAIIAFFLGGMVAGASVPYRSSDTGALNGIVTWATTIVGIILLTGAVGGAIFGALGDVLASQQGNLQNAAETAQATEGMAEDARSAAGWAALGLAGTLAAAAIGGVMGAKMWPHERSRNTSTAARS